MTSTCRITYDGKYYYIKIDKAALDDLILEAAKALHKGKPLFPYWRGVYSLTFFGESLMGVMSRKHCANGCSVMVKYDDFGKAFKEFESYLNLDKVFPTEYPKEALIEFQKLAIKSLWENGKYMIKPYSDQWRKEGEYDDD